MGISNVLRPQEPVTQGYEKNAWNRPSVNFWGRGVLWVRYPCSQLWRHVDFWLSTFGCRWEGGDLEDSLVLSHQPLVRGDNLQSENTLSV